MKTEIEWLEYSETVEFKNGWYFLLIHTKSQRQYQIANAFYNDNLKSWNIKSIGSGYGIKLDHKTKIKYYAKHFGEYGYLRKSEVDKYFGKSNGTPVGLHETPFITANGV